MSLEKTRWMDRAVAAVVTVVFGIAAQSLLSWREIAVLSAAIVRLQEAESRNQERDNAAHSRLLETIEDIDRNQRETARIQSAVVERVEGLRENLRAHEDDHG